MCVFARLCHVCKKVTSRNPRTQLRACQAGVKGAHKPTQASTPTPHYYHHREQASACTSRHPTPADLRRGVSSHPRLCAARRARTFSLTRVEIWLPYFTALAAFVNANSFPAPPPYPSLLQLDHPNGGFGF